MSTLIFATGNDYLTSKEKRWLSEHPVIKIGIDSGYAPYSYLDENETIEDWLLITLS